MPFMSFAQYAKHRNVSRMAVTKAVQSGRIKEHYQDGKRGVISEQADVEWEANTRAEVDQVIDDALSVGYQESRAKKEYEQAEILRLKRLEIEGKLVPLEEILHEFTEIGNEVRNKILSAPSKLKQRCPHISHEDYLVLEEILREALESIERGVAE